jgi:glycosyltransferase involved in cell wall biosynthesis
MNEKKPLSICHISSMHDHTDDRIYERAARGLAREGHQVYYMVSYSKDTVMNGVNIIALKRRNGIVRRIMSSWEAYRKAAKKDFDIYHFHDPDLLPFMVLLKWHGKTVIYDIHENYVVRLKGRGLPKAIENAMAWLWHKFEGLCIKQFDGIIPVTQSIGDLFKKQAKSMLVVSNMVDIELMKDTVIPDAGNKEKIIYVSGNNTPKRNLMQMVQALPMIVKEVPDARMMMVGRWHPEDYDNVIKRKAEELGVGDKLEIGDFMPWKANFNRTAKALIGCVFWTKDENYSITIPARIFEFMFCGVAVLADDTVELRKVVEAGNCGMIVNSDYPEQIAEKAIYMLKNLEQTRQMGKNGRTAMLEKFNFNIQLKEMIEYYYKILETK